MVIATFTSGEFTQIGISSFRVNKTEIIDSKILYHNPEKFREIFLELLESLGIKIKENTNTKLVFGISGTIDKWKKEIIESNVLNDISLSNFFNGFSFVKTFGNLIKAENIYLINTSNCVAFGQKLKYKRKFNFPALSMLIDKEVGISIIKQNGIINYDSAIRPIKHLKNKDANHLICEKGIDDILSTNVKKFSENYTLTLIETLIDILNKLKQDGIIINNVFIHTNKYELIKFTLLRAKLPEIDFVFTNSKGNETNLPIKGTLRYFRNKSSFRKINYILFFCFSIVLGTIITNNMIPNLRPTTVLGDMPGFISFFSLVGLLLGVIIYLLVGNIMVKLVGFVSNSYYPSYSSRIKDIKYYSTSREEYETLDNFVNFIKHWEKTKPIANRENYYSVNYVDKFFVRVYLDDLNSITDLQKYKF